MDLEIIILSEVSQKKINIIWYHLYVEYKVGYKWTYLQNRLTNVENDVWLPREGWERGGLEVWG